MQFWEGLYFAYMCKICTGDFADVTDYASQGLILSERSAVKL